MYQCHCMYWQNLVHQYNCHVIGCLKQHIVMWSWAAPWPNSLNHTIIVRVCFFFVMQCNMRCNFLLERNLLLCKESALDCSQMLTSPFISTVYCELFSHLSKIHLIFLVFSAFMCFFFYSQTLLFQIFHIFYHICTVFSLKSLCSDFVCCKWKIKALIIIVNSKLSFSQGTKIKYWTSVI